MATSSSEVNHSQHWFHLQESFSSSKEEETFLSRYEAARLLLAPGVNKQNATISVLMDHILVQTESVPASRSRTFSSGKETMLDSAG